MSTVTEEKYEELKHNIDTYLDIDTEIKNKQAEMKNLMIAKKELYAQIIETMVRYDIPYLETNNMKITLEKKEKKGQINVEVLESALIDELGKINKTPEDYGVNKMVEKLIDAIEDNREKREEVKVVFKNMKKDTGKTSKSKKSRK